MLYTLAMFAQRCLYPLIAHLAEKRYIEQMLVLDCTVEDTDVEALFRDAAAALAVIRTYDERLLNRIRRDVRCIMLAPIRTSGGEYRGNLRAIMLNSHNVLRQTPEAIAMIIVHEATHARIHTRGVEYASDKERHERACVRAEVRFIRRVPDTDHLVRGAWLKLESRYWEKRL